MWRLLAVLALLFAVACGDHVSSAGAPGSGATPTPIPWIALPASFAPVPDLTPEPMPTNVAACRAVDLSAVHVEAQAGAGWWGGGVRLVTHERRCLLHGYVELRFMDTATQEIVRTVPSAASVPRDWAVLGEAQVDWAWGNWCTPGLKLGSIVAILPGDSTPIVASIDPPMAVGARCSVPNAPAIVSAGPIRSLPTPTVLVTAPPPSLAARIDAPSVTVAGETLRYVVTLMNLTTDVVALDPCPSYLEWLGGHPLPTPSPPPGWPSQKPWAAIARYAGFVKEAHRLNCDGISVIRPRDSIAFEMRIAVPTDAIGPDTLSWAFVGGLPNARAAIAILPR